MKALVVFLQTVSTVLNTFDEVEWTRVGLHVRFGMEKINLQISGLHCSGLTFAGRFYLLLSLIPCTWALVGVSGLAVKLTSSQVRHLYQRVITLVAASGYFFVYPVLEACFSMFSCVPEPIPNPQASYLSSAPWIKCGTHEHRGLVTVAVVTILIIISLLLAIFASLTRFGGAFFTRIIPPRSLAFLSDGFRKGASSFEAAIFGRRFLFALFAAVLPKGSVVTAPILTALLVASLVILLVYRPYERHAVAMRLEVAQLSVAAIILVAVQNVQETSDRLTIILVTIALISGIVGIISYIVKVVFVELWTISRHPPSSPVVPLSPTDLPQALPSAGPALFASTGTSASPHTHHAVQ